PTTHVYVDDDPCATDSRQATAQARCRGSLNQLVGAQQDRGRQLDSDLPSGTQIDHQLEFSGLLDRQLRSVRAFEYLVDISRGAPPQIDLRAPRKILLAKSLRI